MFFKESIIVAENKFDEEVKNILLDQKTKYDILSNMKFNNDLKNCIQNKILSLPQNCLIHGTEFNIKSLLSIKNQGILSSEFALGKEEMHNETYFMADFFKNVSGKELPVKELLECFDREKVINYLPNTKETNEKSQVAFIVNTQNDTIKSYLERDLFNGKNSELWSFVNEDFFFSLERRKRMPQYNFILGQSSIPIGVPYSALCGIIVDKNIELDGKKLDMITKLFGEELFVVSSFGRILSSPDKKISKQIDEIEMSL